MKCVLICMPKVLMNFIDVDCVEKQKLDFYKEVE